MEGFSNPHENKWQMSPKRPSQTLGTSKGSNTNRFPRRPPKKSFWKTFGWPNSFSHGFLDHVFIFGSWSMVKVHVFYPPNKNRKQVPLFDFNEFPLKSQGATCYQHWRKCSTTWGLKGNTHMEDVKFLQFKKNNFFEWMFRGNFPYVWLKIPPMFDWMFRGICQQTYLNYVISIFTPAFFFEWESHENPSIGKHGTSESRSFQEN